MDDHVDSNKLYYRKKEKKKTHKAHTAKNNK